MNITSSAPNLYNSISLNNKNNTKNIAFKGFASKATDSIAKTIIKIIDSDVYTKVVNTTKKHKLWDKNLYPHLIVLGSTLLSGFYVLKTLKNKQMDEDKRKTLAVNQGLTWALSTAMAYTFDGWGKARFDEKVINKFLKVNEKLESESKLKMYKKAFGIAKTMIVIDTVYRFIAPVLVTPIANRIGNKLSENKAAKKAAFDNKA